MVEKVARALRDADAVWAARAYPEKSAEDIQRIVAEAATEMGYESMARAAIEALMEPGAEMLAAFWRQKNCGTQEPGETGDARSDYDAWRAALTAALALPIPGGENTEGEKR